MSPLELIVVSVVGGAGALARFTIDGLVGGRMSGPFPYGTLAVNTAGCLCLGVVTGAALHGAAGEVVETGLIGAFTTFSTWMLETHRLAEDSRTPLAVANIVVSLALGGAVVWAGHLLGTHL